MAVYIPTKTNFKEKYPLFLWLHGGVNTLKEDKGLETITFFLDMAEENNIIVIAPSGQRGATWFDNIGLNNIIQSLEKAKESFPVDTANITLGGVSDGATACYIIANLYPKIFKNIVLK